MVQQTEAARFFSDSLFISSPPARLSQRGSAFLNPLVDGERQVHKQSTLSYLFNDLGGGSITGIPKLVEMDIADAKIAGHFEDAIPKMGACTSGRIFNRQAGAGSCSNSEIGEINCCSWGMGCDRDGLGKRPGGYIFSDFRGGSIIGIAKLVEMDRANASGTGHREGCSDVGAHTSGAVCNRQTRIGIGFDGEAGEVCRAGWNVRYDRNGLGGFLGFNRSNNICGSQIVEIT